MGEGHTPLPEPPDELRGNPLALKQWRQTPERQQLIQAVKRFSLAVLPDDTLFAEGVEPGTYRVNFVAYVDHVTQADGKLSVQAFAKPILITVPEEPATGFIDLGVITLQPAPPPC